MTPAEQAAWNEGFKHAQWQAKHCAAQTVPDAPAEPQPLDANETDPAVLWAEIWRLRHDAEGPDDYPTWKDAAIDERCKRVAAERAAAHPQQPAPLTDEQINDILERAGIPELPPEWARCDFEIARAIERAHGIVPAPTTGEGQ